MPKHCEKYSYHPALDSGKIDSLLKDFFRECKRSDPEAGAILDQIDSEFDRVDRLIHRAKKHQKAVTE